MISIKEGGSERECNHIISSYNRHQAKFKHEAKLEKSNAKLRLLLVDSLR